MGFQLALKFNASQRAAGVVRRRYAHHDAGIGVALIARVLAHAVGHHPAWLRCGGHHRAAGAHAKAVNAATIGRMVHQLIVSRAQQRVAGMLAKPRAVNHALRVLNAKANRKRFGLHVNAALVQHGHRVARAVAECQHDVVCVHLVLRAVIQVLHRQPANATVLNQHITDTLLKSHLAAERDDLLTHVLDHLDQFEGANVRLADQQYLGRCAGFDEFHHDLASQVPRVLDLAPQLAVRKRARTALAKLHVRFRV